MLFVFYYEIEKIICVSVHREHIETKTALDKKKTKNSKAIIKMDYLYDIEIDDSNEPHLRYRYNICMCLFYLALCIYVSHSILFVLFS